MIVGGKNEVKNEETIAVETRMPMGGTSGVGGSGIGTTSRGTSGLKHMASMYATKI